MDVPTTARDLELWLSVRELARAELTTPRQVYWVIDHGLPHSRIGQRIRVRRCDWRRWHEEHVQAAELNPHESRLLEQAASTEIGEGDDGANSSGL